MIGKDDDILWDFGEENKIKYVTDQNRNTNFLNVKKWENFIESESDNKHFNFLTELFKI